MPHKIAILVRADVGRNAIDLIVTGCLTLPTVRILCAQIAKARELGPTEPILVDLTGVQHTDPCALEQMRAAETDIVGGFVAPLRFALPASAPAPTCSRSQTAVYRRTGARSPGPPPSPGAEVDPAVRAVRGLVAFLGRQYTRKKTGPAPS